eukprot:1153615-Pelagomonas_calceolata.AAC.3
MRHIMLLPNFRRKACCNLANPQSLFLVSTIVALEIKFGNCIEWRQPGQTAGKEVDPQTLPGLVMCAHPRGPNPTSTESRYSNLNQQIGLQQYQDTCHELAAVI